MPESTYPPADTYEHGPNNLSPQTVLLCSSSKSGYQSPRCPLTFWQDGREKNYYPCPTPHQLNGWRNPTTMNMVIRWFSHKWRNDELYLDQFTHISVLNKGLVNIKSKFYLLPVIGTNLKKNWGWSCQDFCMFTVPTSQSSNTASFFFFQCL